MKFVNDAYHVTRILIRADTTATFKLLPSNLYLWIREVSSGNEKDSGNAISLEISEGEK